VSEVRRAGAFLSIFFMLVSCRDMPDNQNADPVTISANPAATAAQEEGEFWKPPELAAKTDKSLIIQWFKDNEACAGVSGVSPDDPVCKARDLNQDRLRKHGWCWGAPLSKSAADNDWHRCGTYDTDDLSDAKITEANKSSFNPKADAWVDEKNRQKSPLLQAYESAMEPINQKVGLANVMLQCGIRGNEWYKDTAAALEQYRRQPRFEEMRNRLSAPEAAAAQKFDRNVRDGTVEFNLGDGDVSEACRRISNMPFVNDESVFVP
jgi:hypothetical protein